MKKYTSENYKSYFAYKNYSALDPKERQALLEFTVEQIRVEKGLMDVNIKCEDMPRGSRGYCDQKLNFFGKLKFHNIVLNSDVLYSKRENISYETYNTMNHELEHAMQYENSVNLELSNDIPEVLEQRLNDEHYYCASGDKIVGDNGERSARFDSETDYQLYRAQACESDARVAGLRAVEKLRIDNEQNGINDEYIINYLDVKYTDEIVDNREMLSKLGMHSREQLAKEQLSHINEEKITTEQREKVLTYARGRDYEIAKKVLEDDYYNLTDEEVIEKFNQNEYNDFFESSTYSELKVKGTENAYYKYGNYKWKVYEEKDADLDYSIEKESFSELMDYEKQTCNSINKSLDNSKRIIQENNNY